MGFAAADNVIGTGSIGRGAVMGSNAIGSVLYNQGGTFTPTPPPPNFTYFRPGGVDTYHRPDGTSIYIRP